MGEIVIVLGGIEAHKILIKRLKKRGYYTILVDYLDNPPAAATADEHIKVSTFDTDAIKKLAKERNVKLVINSCLEHLNATISMIAEELCLPHMYSYKTALEVSDKQKMKRIMKENNIPTTDFVCISSTDELEKINLTYPLFVKPADSSGSTGVNRVLNKYELTRFTEIALKSSRTGVAIIEEEAVGKECNVYCIIVAGKAQVLMLSEKYSEVRETSDDNKTTKAIGSLWPANISANARKKIEDAAQGIADSFRLNTTPMFMQLMVNGNEINIIEFACRVAGGYSYHNIKDTLGFDYFDFTISAYLGEKPEFDIRNYEGVTVIHSIYATPCVFKRIDGLAELEASGIIDDYMIARVPGTIVTDESANRAKVGFFTVRGGSVEEVLKKVKNVYEHIEVFDVEEHPAMRKDIYLSQSLLK